jgi:hypothetical protein
VSLSILGAVVAFAAAAWAQNPIQVENAKPGTTDWRLANPSSDNEIEGYASLTSVNHGGQIQFFVNTADSSYTLEVFRMGWYNGAGSRRMTDPVTLSGRVQPAPHIDPESGLAECVWLDPYTLTVSNPKDPSDWVSGVYLAKLTGLQSTKQSYIVFVVRDDARKSDYLYQSSVTTFQAYNNWGGRSLYSFNSDGGAAQKVSFNRPYGVSIWNPDAAQGVGAGEFLTNVQPQGETYNAGFEYNMVRFLEREGYDVTYSTDVDTHENGEALLNHKAFLSVGHDEYWSFNMRKHVESARNRGLHLGFFSSNVSYYQIRLIPSFISGDADRTIVCYKGTSDPFYLDPDRTYLTTDRWRSPAVNYPENALLGVMYVFDPVSTDYIVQNSDNWVYAGTNLHDGDVLPGIVGYEADQIFSNGYTPPNTVPLAYAIYAGGSANMVTYKAPSGANVFATGSQFWVWGLDDDYDVPALRPSFLNPAMQQMARNILARFLAPRKGVAFADNFKSFTTDPKKWYFGVIDEGPANFNPAIPVQPGNFQLAISPLVNAAGENFAGYDSTQLWDVTNGSATVQVLQTTDPVSAADTTFALSIDALNFYRITFENGGLFFQQMVNGVKASADVTYDATQHRWWRIRHKQATDTVQWQTSPDGKHWATQMQQPRLLDIVGMHAELQAGSYEPEATPGTAIFANFRLVP